MLDSDEMYLHNSFASNGECGLKRFAKTTAPAVKQGNSFASNGECGLKQVDFGDHRLGEREFIRQQWRMWIETSGLTG